MYTSTAYVRWELLLQMVHILVRGKTGPLMTYFFFVPRVICFNGLSDENAKRLALVGKIAIFYTVLFVSN